MKMKTTKTITVQGSIPAFDLEAAVRKQLPNDAPWGKRIDITLSVRIPGGGDCSNTNLDMGEGSSHTVDFVATWTETEEI